MLLGGGKPPSPEYVECMRRLQANLSYLAAIADAKKKKEERFLSHQRFTTSGPWQVPAANLLPRLPSLRIFAHSSLNANGKCWNQDL